MQMMPLLISLTGLVASEPSGDVAANHSASVQLSHVNGDVLTVKWDLAEIRQRHQSKHRFVLKGVPISTTQHVDLELTPFSVAGPDTLFVLGRKGAPDEPFSFDTSRVQAFRGRVKDRAGSEVFVVFGDFQTTGYIDLGFGRNRLLISSKDINGAALPHGETSIFPAGSGAGYQPPVPLCGVEDGLHPVETKSAQDVGAGVAGFEPPMGIRRVKLGVTSNFAYFALFGDRDAAAEYLVQMYAQVNNLFLRDAMGHFELARVCVVDHSKNHCEPREYNFDLAQTVSGSRSAPFGGEATGGFCGGASTIYYVQGFFPDPTMPSPYHYDILVAAHELGHNAGASHTHEIGIDHCNGPGETPQRGTIMSYCSQTYSGLNANWDSYFHRINTASIFSNFQNADCAVDDCNLNNQDDILDIQDGTSPDVNDNGIPDECEDCNGNGELDDEDIAGKTSNDVNENGIPDECEPDCNGNGIPDSMDIIDGTSSDLYGNWVPDECETDCNGNRISDYTEIQADMTKDVDRNAALDACQDCDNDGTTDHAALDGSHNLWIVSGLPNAPLREFYATTGVLTKTAKGAVVSEGQDVVIAPDGRILVSSAGTNRIQVYDRSATFLGDFVPPGALGMNFPTGMLVLPDGRLLVASRDTDNVLAFDAISGEPIEELVSAGSGGLVKPYGMTVGPNGNLFVTSETDEIMEYDVLDGSFVRVFVSAAANGGLVQPRDLVFKRDGQLLVTSFGTDEVLAYDGQSGESIGSWVVLGFAVSGMTPVNPWEIEIGPNGNVFVSRALFDPLSTAGAGGGALHLSNAQVFEYDVCNGNFVRVHIGGGDLSLTFPTGFAFMPGWEEDCNHNQLPDTCDVSSGASPDENGNGIPDECETDCNGNGQLDRLDVIPFGTSLDCNNNLSPDDCDIAAGTSSDCDGNGVPDECEPDCNGIAPIDSCGFDAGSATDCDGNGLPDSCEIFDGNAADCNANCVLDVCETDCNVNGVPDDCDVANGTSEDCNVNGVPDECDVIDRTSEDCNVNGVPDECDPDCNVNGIPDQCDIADGTSEDCNVNGFPDECDIDVFFEQVISVDANGASSVFAVDLDGDGNADVLSASFDDDKIAWYKSINGQGNFGPQQVITTMADGARSVFAADLDGDGDTDVLSASWNDDKIAWYENTDELGHFGPQKVITTLADGTWSVFASDLDGDGDIDVLSASYNDDKIAWYENTDGLGNFGPQRIITTVAVGAWSVFAADLDGDGDTDVLSTLLSQDKIVWYENTDGLGSFGAEQVITTTANDPRSVFAADLDGDGDIDVLSASSHSNEIAWYENTNGLGSFGPEQIITTAADGARSVFAADLDDDGDTDVLSASWNDDKIAWYENTDGLGGFGPQRIITTAADGARSVFAAGGLVLSASVIDDKIAWYGRVLDCNGNYVLDECDLTDGTSEDCNADGVPDECEVISILSSNPPDGAIDARQPSEPDGANPTGWSEVVLTFDGDTCGLTVDDFTVALDPPGVPPMLAFVVPDGYDAVLQFGDITADPIPPGHWTIITHNASETSVRIGYLPADVNNDKLSSANDVLYLIDVLNGVIDPAPPAYQTDTDRSGAVNASDVLRVIDLLNGAGVYDEYLDATLPE